MAAEPLTARRFGVALTLAAALLALAAVVAPLVGPGSISLLAAFGNVWPDHEIFFGVRLPRMLLALLAGGALSLAGVVFQAMLRDALAEPYTLGVSSGASFGAVCALSFGIAGAAGLPGIWLCAFGGAAATLVVVLGIAAEGRRLSSFTLLLAGITVNSIALALILLLHSVATFGQSFAIVHWLMGGFSELSYSRLAGLAAVVLPVSALLIGSARYWNLMAVGDDWAATRGVSPSRLMLAGYLGGSLLTATITAVTGPIGFVGLVVPHALRLKLGADHRVLMPCAFLAGAAYLIVCDALSRLSNVPVGVITALIGGPAFIALLRSRRRSLWL